MYIIIKKKKKIKIGKMKFFQKNYIFNDLKSSNKNIFNDNSFWNNECLKSNGSTGIIIIEVD